MGVSKNRGTPKWMVKIMENPIFGNTQMLFLDFLVYWRVIPCHTVYGRKTWHHLGLFENPTGMKPGNMFGLHYTANNMATACLEVPYIARLYDYQLQMSKFKTQMYFEILSCTCAVPSHSRGIAY